jgi:hypothetical protein
MANFKIVEIIMAQNQLILKSMEGDDEKRGKGDKKWWKWRTRNKTDPLLTLNPDSITTNSLL